MTLDKDTVVKHQFWFLLGSFLLVWFIAALWLKFAAGGPIDDKKKAYDQNANRLNSAKKGPKNDSFCTPWEKYGSTFDKHKQVIWLAAWDVQKDMFNWPFTGRPGLIPQDPLSLDDRDKFKNRLYNKEFKDLEVAALGTKTEQGFLAPVELLGGFNAVMKPIPEWKATPSREECWLAQEDFWVKRELLYDVYYRIVAPQSFMRPVKDDEEDKKQLPDGVRHRYRFRNQNWEITLLIKPTKDKKSLVIGHESTIKNVHPGQRVQLLANSKGEGLEFNVAQGKTGGRFRIMGEPVAWNDSKPFASEDYPVLPGIDWTRGDTLSVSQAFDWYTCPVRTIEAIEIGQQSCRTHTTGLKANDTLVKLDPPKQNPEDANAENKGEGTPGVPGAPGSPSAPNPGLPAAAGPGPGREGRFMGPPGGLPGDQPGGRSQAVANPTPNNGLERNRYLQAPKEGDAPEKPSRHLPLAVQLIVDQAHMHDVLVALANSRLRIQITQWQFSHVHNVRPQSAEDKSGNGSEMLRTGPLMFEPGMERGRVFPRAPGMGSPYPGFGGMPPGLMPGRFPRGPGGFTTIGPSNFLKPSPGGPMPPMGTPGESGQKTTSAPNQDDENLVEMTIYGIATLYRQPDPPKTNDPAAPAPPSGAPR